MGSFNVSCQLSNKVIESNDDVVVFLLSKNQRSNDATCYTWDLFSPIPIMFQGNYNTYGGIKNVEIFQSGNLLNEDELKDVKDKVLNKFNEDFNNEGKNKNLTLDDFLGGDDLLLNIKNGKREIYKNLSESIKTSKNKDVSLKLLKSLRVSNVEELDELIKNMPKDKNVDLSMCMIRKDIFLSFIKNYAVEKYLDKDEIYGRKIQEQRNILFKKKDKALDKLNESLKLVNGGDYAGNNMPIYTYDDIKNEDTKLSAKIDLVKADNTLCLLLLSDYFSMLGKTFQPSMYISEEIRSYGYDIAMDMQKEIANSDVPQKAKTIKTIKRI